jgi:hypothetical protein
MNLPAILRPEGRFAPLCAKARRPTKAVTLLRQRRRLGGHERFSRDEFKFSKIVEKRQAARGAGNLFLI